MAMLVCDVCGKQTNEEYRFCPWCGEILDDVKEYKSIQEPDSRPKILYHYTSADAAEKIIAGGQLWATEISDVNDWSEFRHGLGIAVDVTRARLASGQMRSPDMIARVLANLEALTIPEVFVASFSSLGDSRSQWGLYCKGPRGVAIGFEHEKLRKLSPGVEPARVSEDEIIAFPYDVQPCVYSARTQRKLLTDRLTELDNIYSDIEEKHRPPIDVAARDVAQLVSLYSVALKDWSFADELEWRALIGRRYVSKVKSFVRGGTPVFYTELNLKPTPETFPVCELVVGPQTEQLRALAHWTRWLKDQGLEGVVVRRSDVPLREA